MSKLDASTAAVRPVAAARRKLVPGAPPARRGRPPKAQAKAAGETRDLILDAAEDLFSKHGFYGVTIREVAREAGVDT
ncbi:MAG: TetR family transcriptional regulator, partial [Brevundimonas sp. 32-68-21]